MYFSYEVQLVALVFLLYAYDCALLLYANECVVIPRGDEWVALRGSESFLLLGRSPYVMSMVRPDLPIFRGQLDQPVETCAEALWSKLRESLTRVRLCSLVAGVGLFVMLPFALLGGGGHLLFAGTAVVVYGSIAFAVWEIQSRRDSLRLTSGELRTLAIECLACPPFGVNLLRRITLRMDVGDGPSDAHDVRASNIQTIEPDLPDGADCDADVEDEKAHT